MNAKHTPGPYHVNSYSSGMICVDGPDQKTLCAVGCNTAENRDDYANANLFAAAPELLTALRRIVDQIEATDVPDAVVVPFVAITRARAAIAKAEGNS